ncbi:hypothetical protein J6590_099959 [Homalodisca vitripennis]|nr:hypothetical protein J6590_099959 [Homalodisca vitripennis]
MENAGNRSNWASRPPSYSHRPFSRDTIVGTATQTDRQIWQCYLLTPSAVTGTPRFAVHVTSTLSIAIKHQALSW